MKQGFVLGKFLPLHNGHIALINFAKQHCDKLYIIICFTKNESIDGVVRKDWINKEFHDNENISLILFSYDENDLPNTSRSSRDVSKKWAIALKKIIPDVSIVFSSEVYGNYLAEYLNINHLIFDQKRIKVPISASMINDNPFKYWDFLALSARPWFVKKIVLLGTESTGKSTLVKKLAAHFKTNFVPEMAREVIEKTNECTFQHLEEIALLHANKILEEVSQANKILILDTDINVTKSYSKFLFNRELKIKKWIDDINRADLYIYLESDCPFIQDGTRLNMKKRNELDKCHKNQLKENNIEYLAVDGSWENRFVTAIKIIENKFFA